MDYYKLDKFYLLHDKAIFQNFSMNSNLLRKDLINLITSGFYYTKAAMGAQK